MAGEQGLPSDIPQIISVDDHVVEPPTVWLDRLPAKWTDSAPRVRRRRGRSALRGGQIVFVEADDDGARPADVWFYEDLMWPLTRGFAQSGYLDDPLQDCVTFDDMLPGCWQQAARLADMDANHTEASLTFPTFARFCGQTFLERKDKDLALACVRAYNDWMIDEWCGGPGRGRLIPLTLVPLWDAELAAAEVRRCAGKGSHAIAFCEQPYALGLPSIHTAEWNPLFAACEQTQTVVNMHIGSSSTLPTTSPDAPLDAVVVLSVENSIHAFTDWMVSGVLARHPGLTIALSEGQIGWVPFFLERLDNLWSKSERYGTFRQRVPELPSHYMSQIYGCIFDDQHGLASRHTFGMGQVMFETDYPHSDSTFPLSRQTAEEIVTTAGLDAHETWQLLRGNAIDCYGLARFGITH